MAHCVMSASKLEYLPAQVGVETVEYYAIRYVFTRVLDTRRDPVLILGIVEAAKHQGTASRQISEPVVTPMSSVLGIARTLGPVEHSSSKDQHTNHSVRHHRNHYPCLKRLRLIPQLYLMIPRWNSYRT